MLFNKYSATENRDEKSLNFDFITFITMKNDDDNSEHLLYL